MVNTLFFILIQKSIRDRLYIIVITFNWHNRLGFIGGQYVHVYVHTCVSATYVTK